jgi:hypothetical protein
VRQDHAKPTEVKDLLDGPLEIFIAILRDPHKRRKTHTPIRPAVLIHLSQNCLNQLTRERGMLHINKSPLLGRHGRATILQGFNNLIEPTGALRMTFRWRSTHRKPYKPKRECK